MSKKLKYGGVIVCGITAIIALVQEQHPEIQTSQAGLEIIGNAEGCRRDPYKCPADVLTVGIGSTEASGQKIDKNRKYSDLEIAERWVKDIQIAEKCVNLYGNGRNLPQGAFEAMTSITFNVGCGKMKKSTLFKMANRGYSPEMCQQFERWVYAGGKKLRGLEIRREKEKALCLTGLAVQ
ncbi:lysozyme [Mannheimia pernigra]|uniref:Lysozyme n=1 Tax=Mannheimia pernigra TaxID=111844 RepID=A0A7D5IAW0_9PAST|nr:lysozyme [Mannheimia pernigra]QLB40813.1 lysozyme [Mannheimia pernigra]